MFPCWDWKIVGVFEVFVAEAEDVTAGFVVVE